MSYCIIVTERHASSTSSPKGPPTVVSQRGRRAVVSLTTSHSCEVVRHAVSSPATTARTHRVLRPSPPRRAVVHCSSRVVGAAKLRESRVTPRRAHRERRCTASGEHVSWATRPPPTAPGLGSSNLPGRESKLQLTRNCAASTGAVSLLSERSAYNHECGPRTAACACRLQQ